MATEALRCADPRIGLHPGRGSLGDEVGQRAGLHALLPEAGKDVGDVGQEGLVRSDEQHATRGTQAGFGVEQVRGTVQGDDGLPGARAAVDDEGTPGARADDGVLVGRDGGEHVPHPVGAVLPQADEKGGLVVERARWPSNPSEVNTSSQ